jgi:hypothetical protein
MTWALVAFAVLLFLYGVIRSARPSEAATVDDVGDGGYTSIPFSYPYSPIASYAPSTVEASSGVSEAAGGADIVALLEKQTDAALEKARIDAATRRNQTFAQTARSIVSTTKAATAGRKGGTTVTAVNLRGQAFDNMGSGANTNAVNKLTGSVKVRVPGISYKPVPKPTPIPPPAPVVVKKGK